MGIALSRIGSDPYYANYEKSLSRIQTDVTQLKARLVARRALSNHIRSRFLGGFAAMYVAILAYAAWVARAPAATYTHREHAVRVAPALLAPPTAWVLYRLLSWVLSAMDSYTARRVAALDAKLRKMVTELKESSRYDRTLALLKKFDPDYKAPLPVAAPQPQRPGGAAGQKRGPAQQQQKPGGSGSGSRMVPALAELWTRAADKLIADDPVALRLLQEAQREAAELRAALVAAETETLRLQVQNRHLLAELGLEGEAAQGVSSPSAATAADKALASPDEAKPPAPPEASADEQQPDEQQQRAPSPVRKRLV